MPADDSLRGSSSVLLPSTDTRVDESRQLEHFAELGRMSASLLHEISNPLTAAMLYLEQYNYRQTHAIRQVRRNIMLLQRYVEAARQQVRHESLITNFSVRPQIEQVRRILTPLARRKAVLLQFQAATNYKLWGDPVIFQQILANLIANAIDAYDIAEQSSVSSKTVTISFRNAPEWLLIEVIDHGIGITPEQQQYLFEPFYSTKYRQGRGLGIGLTIVKQHVEQDFKGSIEVTSSPQQGTSFTARLKRDGRHE